MEGLPTTSTDPVAIWGAFGFVIAILGAIIGYLIRQIDKRETYWGGEAAKLQATIVLKEQRNAELSDRLVTVSVNANTNANQSQQLAVQMNATANQFQSIATSLQALVDRLLSRLAT